MKKTFAIATLLCMLFACKREMQSLTVSEAPSTGPVMAPSAGGGGGNTWTLIGFSTPIGRREGMCSFVIGSNAYVFGGRDVTTSTYKRELFRFNPSTGTWTQMASLPSLGLGRSHAVSFAINGKGYIATGQSGDIFLKDVWEYDPSLGDLGSWTKKADLPDTVRCRSVGFTINGKGYVGLGRTPQYLFKDLWEYDPVSNTWLQKADMPDEGREDAFAFVCNNKAYIGCGLYLSNANVKPHMWEFNPVTNAWIQKSDYPGLARNSHFFWSNGYSGFVGGGRNNTDDVTDFWIYSPNIDTWTKKADFTGYKRYGSVGFYVSSRGYAGFGANSVYMSTNDLYRYNQ